MANDLGNMPVCTCGADKRDGRHHATCPYFEACPNCAQRYGEHLAACPSHPQHSGATAMPHRERHDTFLRVDPNAPTRNILTHRSSIFSVEAGTPEAKNIHLLNQDQTLLKAKEQALEILDDLRAKIDNGEIVAFAAVGIQKDDDTREWTSASGKTRLQLVGAVTGLLFGVHNRAIRDGD